jgi:hypothetical protein
LDVSAITTTPLVLTHFVVTFPFCPTEEPGLFHPDLTTVGTFEFACHSNTPNYVDVSHNSSPECITLFAGARVRDVEPVPVARPTGELGVGVPTVAVQCKIRALYPARQLCEKSNRSVYHGTVLRTIYWLTDQYVSRQAPTTAVGGRSRRGEPSQDSCPPSR